jgi:molybdopterin/thiamine biosynthesis adenylyltransferase
MSEPIPLTDEERSIYQWQIWVEDFGERGQQALKNSTVLISRVGGLGGVVAYELAAAGVGKLILAHAGSIRPSDLNRQLLMTHAGIGQSRVASAARRLKELNPRLEIEAIDRNLDDELADRLVHQADVVVDCAPRFEERYAMNDAALRHAKPLVECAMYDLEVHLFCVLPGQTACVRCLYPQTPVAWRREFPVFGAVSGMVGCLGAMEAVKLMTGIGEPLAGRMLIGDLRAMRFRQLRLQRRDGCVSCQLAPRFGPFA